MTANRVKKELVNGLKFIRFLIVTPYYSLRKNGMNLLKTAGYICKRRRKKDWSLHIEYSPGKCNPFLVRDLSICNGLITTLINRLKSEGDNNRSDRYSITTDIFLQNPGVSYEIISLFISNSDTEICFRMKDDNMAELYNRKDELHVSTSRKGKREEAHIPISFQTFLSCGRGSILPQYFRTWARNKIKSLPPGSFVIGISFFDPSSGTRRTTEYCLGLLHRYIDECSYYQCILFDPPDMVSIPPYIDRSQILVTKRMGFSFEEEISLVGAVDLFIGFYNEYAIQAINTDRDGYILMEENQVYDIRRGRIIYENNPTNQARVGKE